ncbi:hypothetical protein PFISCL1PPCAC_17509, partial [Pristionchus fissidentatus]
SPSPRCSSPRYTTLAYSYGTFFTGWRYIETAQRIDEPEQSRTLFNYFCVGLAASTLLTAISLTCACLDRSNSERFADALVFTFITALTLLGLSQIAAIIIIFTLEEHYVAQRVYAIAGSLVLAIIVI